jgi:two-component system LytT family sensor kinase
MRGNVAAALALVGMLAALVGAVYAVVRLRARRGIATATQRATYEVLHVAALAAEPLRAGLTAAAAAKAVRHLRTLTGAAGFAITGTDRVLAHDGAGMHHERQLLAAAIGALSSGRSAVLGSDDLACDRVDCVVRGAVVVPVSREGGSAPGTLVAVADGPVAPGLVQATVETARWVAAQLAVAELDSSRARLARAEVRALRAQISPHFIYNALTAIASFVRTDPELARELILEFAEFTRYSFRAHGEFTTLADELRSIDRYLTIERAR